MAHAGSLSAAAATGDLSLIHDMMARGGHIDERDTQLNTPLHHACLAGHLDAVELLLSYGADVNAENSLGKWCVARVCAFVGVRFAWLVRCARTNANVIE